MTRKLVAMLGLGVVGILSVALVLTWWLYPRLEQVSLHGTSAYRSAYEQVRLGQTETDVLQLVPSNAVQPNEVMAFRSVDWQGEIDGETRQVSFEGRRGPGDEPVEPALAKSLLVRLQKETLMEQLGEGHFAFKDRGTGSLVARQRFWLNGSDYLTIVLGPEGKVVEKAFYRFETR